MEERLGSKIAELLDEEKENQLREKIRKRLLKIGQDEQIDGRHLGKIWENCIEPIDRLRKSRNMPGLDGWYCGLGRLIDWADSEIYAVLPYLLTSYMYNFYLQTERKSLYLDSRWLTRDTLAQKFFKSCNAKAKKVNGKALFRLEDANLPQKGIAALLFETGNSERSTEDTQLWRQIDYLARDFIFPKMKPCEAWLSNSAAWIPKMFRQDAKEIAKELKITQEEAERILNNRNVRESITINGFRDIYIAWFYVLHRHREVFKESFQLDPLTSTILFYKNISTRQGLIEQLRWLGVEDADNVVSATKKIETALLDQYDRRVGQNQ